MKKFPALVLFVNSVYRKHKAITRVVCGFICIAVLLACVLFPQMLLANQTPVPLKATFPSDISVSPDHSPKNVQQVDLQERRLIALLTSDVEIKSEPDGWQRIRMRVTAYCPCSKCCGEYSDGITACNHFIQDGDRFVAADKHYPFGTEMIIPGYNESNPVEVKDRGGAIKNDKLDVFFNTHDEALAWGVQYLDVLVKVP